MTYAFADAAAAFGFRPEISPQSIAVEKAQPVPWVELVAILSPGSHAVPPMGASRKSSGRVQMTSSNNHSQLRISLLQTSSRRRDLIAIQRL